MSTSTNDIAVRLQVVNGNVSGVVKSSLDKPMNVNTSQLPLIYSRWDNNLYEYGSMSVTFHYFEVVVLVNAIAQDTYPAHMKSMRQIADSIRDVYAARLHLNDDAGVSMTNIAVCEISDARNGPPEQVGDTAYSTVRCTLAVKNISEVTVSG